MITTLPGIETLVAGVNHHCQMCHEFVYGRCGGYAGGRQRPACFDAARRLQAISPTRATRPIKRTDGRWTRPDR